MTSSPAWVGDAEVRDAPPPIAIDENVLGLEIAMDDAHGMRRGQTAQHAVHLRRDLRHGARAGAGDQIAHGAILGELHRVPGDVAATVPIVDRDDGRMRELRRELRLATEATDRALVARDVRVQQLERDLAPEREIAHAPHGSEGPRAKRRDDLVVVGKRPAQPHLGRLARRRSVLTAQREHGAASDDRSMARIIAATLPYRCAGS